MVPLNHVILYAVLMFAIGLYGALARRNVFIVLMGIELMLNAANIAFIGFASHLGNIAGQIISIFVITVAAGEAAVGLAIVVAIFRNRLSVNIDSFNLLKW